MNIDKRWMILFLLFFARISLGFQFQTMGSVSSQVIDELDFNYTQIGSLIGLFMVPGLFLDAFWPALRPWRKQQIHVAPGTGDLESNRTL